VECVAECVLLSSALQSLCSVNVCCRVCAVVECAAEHVALLQTNPPVAIL